MADPLSPQRAAPGGRKGATQAQESLRTSKAPPFLPAGGSSRAQRGPEPGQTEGREEESLRAELTFPFFILVRQKNGR